ncbi:hypothetical protein J4G66_06010 [Aeromonas dhakensis]|uniref:MBL fold metallo-hydrolase n=1 Tax=Aeromonas dhakensis TaxID=196024 RepID=UPI001BCA6D6F|nr:MBL fold metallo-hydrolase [Aeromonas dhakensis]MBS4715532.1 hypothetical protein [Aeromonas dhakensis]
MDKFISINVNQGDSFYLERSGVKILVDGGRARLGFPRQFESTIGEKQLDLVVCTHADADHINGLLGFFEAGLKAKEVWLPGKWTSRLRELLINPEGFVVELVHQILRIDTLEISSLEKLSEIEEFPKIEEDNIGYEELRIEIDQIYQAIEESSDRARIFDLSMWPLQHFLWFYDLSPTQRNLFVDAIDTANKIRELAVLSYHSGAKIRWFEFDSFSTASGGESFLRPVNSQEIFSVSSRLSALAYLSISKSNRESLVFHSPASDRSSSILFSADSDFSFHYQLPDLEDNSIITAPHHGSEHNRNAYLRLNSEGLITKQTIFVRSDGRFSKRPGNVYILEKSKKICTLCRHPNAESQDVIFTSSSSGWRKKNGLSWCHCI